MPIFIELTTDAFEHHFLEKAAHSNRRSAGKSNVRRPLRGIEVKEDTYAYMKLVDASGKEIDVLNSSSRTGYSKEFSNFMLQAVSEQRMEKHQVIETFGESYLMFFGAAPRFLQVNATLLNSYDFNWEAEFLANYERYFRGTKSIEKGARTYLYYDATVVEGYLINMQVSKNAENPWMIPLQFQFFVTNSENLTMATDNIGKYSVTASAVFPSGVNVDKKLAREDIARVISAGGSDHKLTEEDLSRIVDEKGFVLPSVPLRSYFADNLDEFTAYVAPEKTVDKSYLKTEKQVDNERLESAMGRALEQYGVPPSDANSPNTQKKLGMGPTFMPGKDGGIIPTYNASPYRSFGDFSGMNLKYSSNASFSSGYQGLSSGALSGVFSSSLNLGIGAVVNEVAATLSAVASGIERSSSNYRSSYLQALSSENSANFSSFSTSNQIASAVSGGYVGANSYLAFSSTSLGVTHGTSSSNGASVHVTGSYSLFSSSVLSGSIINESSMFGAI